MLGPELGVSLDFPVSCSRQEAYHLIPVVAPQDIPYVFYREEQLQNWQTGLPINVSRASISRWLVRIHPYRQTGNKERSQIVGIDLLQLINFIIAYPDATIDEMIVFMYNQGGELYSRKVVSQRLKELDIMKKKASIEAYQAQRQHVQFRVELFFNEPLPLGIRDVPRRRIVDFDEFGVTLEKCNRTGGWRLKVHRVRKDGHYHHGSKITCIFAIEPGDPNVPGNTRGSLDNPRRWIRCLQSVGTSSIAFRDFCDHVCTDIEQNPVAGSDTDNHRVFMWDNLAAHHSNYVHQTVTGRAGPCTFSIVARPQYHPKFGPIEYKICDLTEKIRLEKEEDWTMQMLEQAILNAAHVIGPFDSTFFHCGYIWT